MKKNVTIDHIMDFYDGKGDAETRAAVAQYLYENDEERQIFSALKDPEPALESSPAVRKAVLERYAPQEKSSLLETLAVKIQDTLQAATESGWLQLTDLTPSFATRAGRPGTSDLSNQLGWQREFGRFKVVIKVLRIREGTVNLTLEVSDPTKNELPEMRAELIKYDEVLESRLLQNGMVSFESYGIADYIISVIDADGVRFAFQMSLLN